MPSTVQSNELLLCFKNVFTSLFLRLFGLLTGLNLNYIKRTIPLQTNNVFKQLRKMVLFCQAHTIIQIEIFGPNVKNLLYFA